MFEKAFCLIDDEKILLEKSLYTIKKLQNCVSDLNGLLYKA